VEELLSGQNTYCTLCTNLYVKCFLEIHVLLLCVFCSVHSVFIVPPGTLRLPWPCVAPRNECKCVLYYCHLVSNELKSTNASINLYLSITNINDVLEMHLADLSNHWKYNDKYKSLKYHKQIVAVSLERTAIGRECYRNYCSFKIISK